MGKRESSEEDVFTSSLVERLTGSAGEWIGASPEKIAGTFKSVGLRKVTGLGDAFDATDNQSALAADNIISWRQVQAAALGAGMGFTGPLMIVPEFASLIVLAVKTGLDVGQCYGFPAKDEGATKEAWLLVAASWGIEKAGEGLAEICLKTAPKAVQRNPYAKMPLISLVRELAKHLGIKLYKRHFARLVPILGGLVGGVANWMFVAAIGALAKKHFKEKRANWRAAGASPWSEE